MAVVTLGGLTGGGGRLLGPKLAERLNADYVDRLILTNAARHAGVGLVAERDEQVARGQLGDTALAVEETGGDEGRYRTVIFGEDRARNTGLLKIAIVNGECHGPLEA